MWSDFEDTPDPDFDVSQLCLFQGHNSRANLTTFLFLLQLSIFLPPVKNLRLFVDRMKRFARFIVSCLIKPSRRQGHNRLRLQRLPLVRLHAREIDVAVVQPEKWWTQLVFAQQPWMLPGAQHRGLTAMWTLFTYSLYWRYIIEQGVSDIPLQALRQPYSRHG